MKLNAIPGATAIATNKPTALPKRRHQQKPKHIKLNDELKLHIQQKIALYWSPEQISGRLRMEENISISTESIYRLILKDKVAGGSLYRYLRHQGKKYRKRYGKNDYRGRIPNRVDIADRPRIVDSRSRIGVVIEGEADCVIGKVVKGCLPPLLSAKVGFISHFGLRTKPQKKPTRLYSGC